MAFETALREKITASKFGSLEKDILKIVLGEIQQKNNITDEACYVIVKKLIKSNDENIGYLKDEDSRKEKYTKENIVLESLLPNYLSLEEVMIEFQDIIDLIKNSDNDGRSIGIAMNHCKKTGLMVEGETVRKAVQKIRNS